MITVRDELAFAEMSEEHQELIRRLYHGGVLGRVIGATTEPDESDTLVGAYKQGWQDAIDEIEWSMPDAPSDADARSALNRKRR